MNNTLSIGKEIKIPGPDHPIAISPAEGGRARDGRWEDHC